MDLRQLRYFVVVAEERNFSRAAARLHMAQPPLSRQIQQLEAELGVALLDRQTRPLRLTPVGRLVFDQAQQLLGRASELRDMVARAKASRRRRLVIGFVASVIYERLPPLIQDLRTLAPDIDVSLQEMISLEQIAALKDGRIDVGFGRLRFDDPSVRRIVLRDERLVAALPASHPLAQEPGPASLADLAGFAQILYPREPRPSYADAVLALYRDQGLTPAIAHEARELQIALGLVAAGEGVCLVPESVQKSRIDDVRYRPLAEAATSPIIMSTRADDHSTELRDFALAISRRYQAWEYAVPEAISRLALGSPAEHP